MAQWIVDDFERPSEEVIEQMRTIPTSILSDCMNRLQTLSASIHPITRKKTLCGPAFTVQSMESCNWAAHFALTMAKPGDVLVVAARGSLSSAVWGHAMTVAAEQRAVAGIVIDGCVRDIEETRESTLPIFCRGSCPGGPHKGWPGNIGIPISLDGVAVLPGDSSVALRSRASSRT